ncbi:hypothetical protein [Nocardiopsis ansamitocini]|nr:hypothetical protein [Nocardiopsis ansamitocini]
MLDSPAAPVAYGDESFLESDSHGFYVLATAVFEPHAIGEARAVMSTLWKGSPTSKLHWNDLTPRQRENVAKTVADLAGFHIVAVGSPVPRRRQERARAVCLNHLVDELHGYGVDTLYLEARDKALNQRDVQTVTGARFNLPRGTRFRVEHHRGGSDPLLWVPDVVAGAVRAHRQGEPLYRDILAECLYDLDVTTGC